MYWHSEYRGQTVGRIKHCLDVYCKDYYDLRELTAVGDGVVTLSGKVVATYEWEGDSDTPNIQWDKKLPSRSILESNQRLLKPFLDDRTILLGQSPTYVVQQIRQGITFMEALAIRWCKENSHPLPETIREKVAKVIHECYWRRMEPERIAEITEHFAFCAIDPIV